MSVTMIVVIVCIGLVLGVGGLVLILAAMGLARSFYRHQRPPAVVPATPVPPLSGSVAKVSPGATVVPYDSQSPESNLGLAAVRPRPAIVAPDEDTDDALTELYGRTFDDGDDDPPPGSTPAFIPKRR